EDTKKNSVVTSLGSFAVIHNWEFRQPSFFVIGVGSPSIKRVLVQKALEADLRPFPTIIHPRATVQDAQCGVGGIITPGVVVTTNVKIGDYVILNLNVTVGHDSEIHDYCTINPGCAISGNTSISSDVLFGTGSVCREGIKIASENIFGAQSAVV